jgi:RNA-directed DNA polymerase
LIQKWLKAGVLEDGKRTVKEAGTVQGGSISPVLANIYLHYGFDLWAHRWRRKQARGEVYMVRFADDVVACFQYRHEAEGFLEDLKQRFLKFALQVNLEKTQLIEFDRFAAENRRNRSKGKPETFNFLGFTHICGKTRGERFTVLRKTIRKKLAVKLKEVRAELKRRMHEPVPVQGAYLRSVVSGHIRYFGVPMNGACIGAFHMEVCRTWMKVLRRRSQKHNLKWERMKRLIAKWLPPARICHPYPEARFGVIT